MKSQWALVDGLVLGRQDAWWPGCNWDGVIRTGWWHFRQLLCAVIARDLGSGCGARTRSFGGWVAKLSGSGYGLEQDSDVKLPGLKGGNI